MGEWNPFEISEFTWDIIQVYLKHGYENVKLYETTFFSTNLTDETVWMTIGEFSRRVVDDNGTLWIVKSFLE